MSEEKEQNTKQKSSQKIVVTKKVGEVERYFFKYAFPCAQVKVRLHSLTQEQYDKLNEIFLIGSSPDKESLEKTFPPAFRRIKKLAEKLGKDMWDSQVIKEYWIKNHNEVIDEGEGMYGIVSENFRDLCKIHVAKIIQKNKDNMIVKYDGRERAVSGILVPDAEQGDKVRIHFAYAVEKVD